MARRRSLTREERIERIRDVLDFRGRQLKGERETATPKRAKQIDAELGAIEERRALVHSQSRAGLRI
jgi:hypothetical protein